MDDSLKRSDHHSTSYLHDEDSVILDQNLNFTTSSHSQSLSVQDSPTRKSKRHKKTYTTSVDDSEHLGGNEISAISQIDSLSHSSGNTIAVPATTIPYIPVMQYPSYEYNMLLRSDGTNGTTTTTSQQDVSHVNNNNNSLSGQVQFGLPWISGGYPSSIPVVQVDPNQYQEMLMQQMRYADVRVLQQRSDNEATTPDGTVPVTDKRNTVLPTSYPFSGGRFFLVEQPNVRQRKSYKNENRYILPNPLTICAREEGPDEKLPKILEGTVSVKLVNADGQELPPSKQNVLVSPDGALTLNLDRNNSAHFSLKVLETSEGTMFRLLFVVNFSLENVGTIEERILSRPFQVYSNRKKNSKAERPIVLDMKPMEGPISSETEIWIKGRGFCDKGREKRGNVVVNKCKVVVLFGDKVGRVVETSENLITVYAPSRFDLPTNTPVTVTVSNRTQQDILSAEKQITFMYYVG